MSFDFERDLVASMAELQRYARRLVGDPTRAEDLVQDCLERALRSRDRFVPGTNLQAWLTTILKNLHFTAYHRERRMSCTEVVEDSMGAGPAQEWRVMLREVGDAIEGLSAEHRQLIRMVGVEGASYEEAAAALGTAMGTIRSRLCRARMQLRADTGARPRQPEPAAPSPGAGSRTRPSPGVPGKRMEPGPPPLPAPEQAPALRDVPGSATPGPADAGTGVRDDDRRSGADIQAGPPPRGRRRPCERRGRDARLLPDDGAPSGAHRADGPRSKKWSSRSGRAARRSAVLRRWGDVAGVLLRRPPRHAGTDRDAADDPARAKPIGARVRGRKAGKPPYTDVWSRWSTADITDAQHEGRVANGESRGRSRQLAGQLGLRPS